MTTQAALLAAVLSCSAVSCTSSSPSGPSGSLNLAGRWTGSGTDAQGPETFVWTITQSNGRITGNIVMEPRDPSDGSCGSCHKQKAGVFSGTLSGSTLTLTMDFPAGGADLTPLCGLTMTATTSDIAAGRIAAAYTGTTTCEGPITDGQLLMTR